jgi:hypothetical protein
MAFLSHSGNCWNSITQLHCDGTCAEENFHVWVEQMSPYFLTANMRVRQFILLLTAGFCIGVALTGIFAVLLCFPLTSFPLHRFVPSHNIPYGQESFHILFNLLSTLSSYSAVYVNY